MTLRHFLVDYPGPGYHSHTYQRVDAVTAYDAVREAVGVVPLGPLFRDEPARCWRAAVRWGVDGYDMRVLRVREVPDDVPNEVTT